MCIRDSINILIDPGIGFGKNLKHNITLISKISIFHSLGFPILVGVSRKKFIKDIGKKITEVPDDFIINRKVLRQFQKRNKNISEEKGIDWATAEALAFGTLLTEGFSDSLSGQDSGTRTISQRHAVLRNQDNHERYVPLNNINKSQKRFERTH